MFSFKLIRHLLLCCVCGGGKAPATAWSAFSYFMRYRDLILKKAMKVVRAGLKPCSLVLQVERRAVSCSGTPQTVCLRLM